MMKRRQHRQEVIGIRVKFISHVGWATSVAHHFFNEEAVARKGLCPPYLTT
ncbi:MAG: hypothetical protein KAI83_08280 [Thiomargarita sp.]|nr:hypothetical protein [Thiomargarita sp.]